jgi:hypothetical protein
MGYWRSELLEGLSSNVQNYLHLEGYGVWRIAAASALAELIPEKRVPYLRGSLHAIVSYANTLDDSDSFGCEISRGQVFLCHFSRCSQVHKRIRSIKKGC